jgi:hypothetical protein
MSLRVNNHFFKEFEEKILTLNEQEQLLAKRLLKIIQTEIYDQDRHIRRFNKALNDVTEDVENKLSLLVDLTRKLLGNHQASVLQYIITHATEYPYSVGYDRRPFRTKNLNNHLERIIEKCISLYELAKYHYTVMDFLTKRNHDLNYDVISDLIAFELDHNNEQVLEALKDIIYGDNNTAFLTQEIIKGLLLSHREDAYQMLGELLIAARLQEGLRQSIVETMDEGTLTATVYLLKIIIDHNLIRYSSVVRALDVWTGLALEAENTRVIKQCIQYVNDTLRNEKIRQEWLNSEDANKLYISLWSTAVMEEEDLEQQVTALMNNEKTYQKIAALLMLMQKETYQQRLQSSHLKFNITREWNILSPFYRASKRTHLFEGIFIIMEIQIFLRRKHLVIY